MAENTKKFLWLAAAVSLFVLVVAGAAFFIFAPGKSKTEVPFTALGQPEARRDSPQDYLADAPADMTTQTTRGGDIIIVYGNDSGSSTTLPPAESQPAPTTIYVSPTTTLPPPAAAAPQPAPTPQPAPKAAAPAAPSPKPAVKTTTTVAKAPAATTAKAAPAAPASTGSYWIQAGLFSVKGNADALKAAFVAKGLPAVIQVKDVDGKSHYIVKVGPYPTKTEAGKWLASAKAVKGAEQSWITQ